MVAPPFKVTNNYLNSANAHIATAVLSNGADEHSLTEISLRRMNLMSERAMQAGMQFSMVTATSTSQQQRQAGNEVEGTGAGTGATTTTTTEIPMTEPKPVLVGMTREVALQRLQDLARVSSSDLTGVTASKGLRSQPKSPIRTKREEGLDDDERRSHRDSSTDGESDDDGGPRVYASQHAQRIPTGAGLKARNLTALSASHSASASAAPLSPTNSLIPMPRGGGGTLSQGDNYRGLSVLTVGHLVPRPFLPDDGMASGMPTSAASGALSSAGGPGTGADRGGPSGWPMVMSNGGSGPVPGVPGVGMGVNVAIDPMFRIPSPPAASPPSLSATDPRPLVHVYPPPTSPPPSLSSSIPSGGGGAMTSPRQSKLRVRRSTYVPGWAVPPRVLLVEDDLVSRRLSSKFLQVSGCEIGVAVDGLGAVSKMELEKYDLVLMVRWPVHPAET